MFVIYSEKISKGGNQDEKSRFKTN